MPIIITLIVIIDAYTDAWRRKHAYTGKWWTTIYHTIEATIYVAACAILVAWVQWWWVALYALFVRAALFNPVYNTFMGHDLDYVGEYSLIDRIERRTGIPSYVFRLVYVFLLMALNLLYYLNLFVWQQ